MADRGMNLVILSGGVGGAKLVDGLAAVLAPEQLTVVVNTGDDFDHLGLRICPDLDTVLYTLAGLADPETGWGRGDESWNFLQTLTQLGGPSWFRLGDHDLALHVERTRRLDSGEPLSRVMQGLARALGVRVKILPMSDDATPTMVTTDEGSLPFQEYFVARAWQPKVLGFTFAGIERARPAPGVLEALHTADAVVFGPSNPWVSVDPILAVPGIRDALAGRRVLAVSPIVAGLALKGPAAKMFIELGIPPSAVAVAEHYRRSVTDFVLDRSDSELQGAVQDLGMRCWLADSVMATAEDRLRLARRVVALLKEPLREGKPA